MIHGTFCRVHYLESLVCSSMHASSRRPGTPNIQNRVFKFMRRPALLPTASFASATRTPAEYLLCCLLRHDSSHSFLPADGQLVWTRSSKPKRQLCYLSLRVYANIISPSTLQRRRVGEMDAIRASSLLVSFIPRGIEDLACQSRLVRNFVLRGR